MFKKMQDTINFAMNAKNHIKNSEVLNTIITIASHSLTSDYILLVPNEKNIKDATNFQNIDGAEVYIKDNYDTAYDFGVAEVIFDTKNTNAAIEVFKKNSIIIVNDLEKINEFREYSKVADELAGTTSRHFERRCNTTVGWRNASLSRRQMSDFWKKETRDDDFVIQSIDFDINDVSLCVKHSFQFNPKPLCRYHKSLHVVNDLAHQMSKYVKNDAMLKGYKSKVVSLDIYADIAPFDIVDVEGQFVPNYAEKQAVNFMITSDSKFRNRTDWILRFEIPFRDFMQHIINFYNKRMKS